MGRFALCLLVGSRLFAAGTTARFDLESPDTGPFPSDAFTVADAEQKTGRRVNLPLPDCLRQPSSCNELNLVNQLDGFSVNARVRVRFSAPVDISTLAAGIVLIALDNKTQDEIGIHRTGEIVKVNQVVYDPASDTAYAKPDHVLDQHRVYALVATDAIKDAAGDPVSPDPAYTACAQGSGGAYCTALAAAVPDLASKTEPRRIVGASLFTTMSATAWLESARAALDGAGVAVTLAEPKATWRIAELSGLTINQQTGASPVKLSSFSIPLDPALLQGLGSISIGSFRSPSFLDERQTIAPLATGVPLKLPGATSEVFFNVLLPEGPKPQAGYPVVIFGHGFGDSRFGGPTAVSPVLTTAGFAVIAINAAGHGFGPESSVTFKDREGKETVIRTGGRSVDLNGDGRIEGNEGCSVTLPVAIGLRDCFRQTAVDLLQLVRVIRGGLDLDGDGFPELDAGRIYYGGQSLGAIYGTIFNAVEPNVRAATLNVGGASLADIARWSPSYRGLATETFRARVPSLLNEGDSWNEDYVLRDKPAKRVTVQGAMALQDAFETLDWLGCLGDPIAFAPHLKTSPLTGMVAKPVLFQFALGDRTVPNSQNSALIRAADMRESSWLYRHDLARRLDGSLPVNPHAYLVLFVDLDGETLKLAGQGGQIVSGLTQRQMASFFAADGGPTADPNNALVSFAIGGALFEIPARLPEDPGF